MKVGLFHFGCSEDQKNDPVGSLEGKLTGRDDLRGGLIVLPEAFNARGGYYNDPVALDESACSRLQSLSARYEVGFVAGLIEPEIAGIKGYNEAYLIDGTYKPVLLSRKRRPGPEKLYTACLSDQDQPVPFHDFVIAARICEDAAANGPPLDCLYTAQ